MCPHPGLGIWALHYGKGVEPIGAQQRLRRLGAISTVRQSLGMLLENELVHQEQEGYRVTDVFFGHWLAGG